MAGRLWQVILLLASLLAQAEEVSELVRSGSPPARVLHGCHRDRPEFSHVRGRPLVSGVDGKAGLVGIHIVWSLRQVLLAQDCVDAFEVEFQQVLSPLKSLQAGLQKIQASRWLVTPHEWPQHKHSLAFCQIPNQIKASNILGDMSNNILL